jgi:hypothetical protein
MRRRSTGRILYAARVLGLLLLPSATFHPGAVHPCAVRAARPAQTINCRNLRQSWFCVIWQFCRFAQIRNYALYKARKSHMTNVMRIAIALIALTSLPYVRAQGLGQIYVYVQRETPAHSWFPVSCDRSVIAKVKRGRFFAINVAPGRHMISDEKGIAFIDVPSGGKVFVSLEWRNGERGGPAIPFPVWSVVHPLAASRDMMYLTYIDTDKVLSKWVPKTDPRKLPSLQLQRRSTTDQ